MRIHGILTIFLGFFLLMNSGCQTNARTPNIVFILIDDLGWYDISCNGNPWFETPNIDKLSEMGLSFTRAYSSPLCTPTRAALMTGKYPGRLGMTRVGDDYDRGKVESPSIYHPVSRQKPEDLWDELSVPVRVDLPLDEITLGEVAKEAGYKTCFIGKWHLGFDEYYPDHQGFDWVFGGDHWSDYFAPWAGERTKTYKAETGEYITDRVAGEAVRFIEKNKKDKFLLCLWNYGIHAPIEGKPELVDYYARKIPGTEPYHPVYAAMVHSVDQCVGQVLDCLEENRLMENTLIVFMSDNGPLTSTVSDGIYDPRLILNRHTANDQLSLGDTIYLLEQEFQAKWNDFCIDFSITSQGRESTGPTAFTLPEDMPPGRPVLIAEVYSVGPNPRLIIRKAITRDQLRPGAWCRIPGMGAESGNYKLRLTLADNDFDAVVPVKSTFDTSIPGSVLSINGVQTEGSLYLRCMPAGAVHPYFSGLTSSGPFRGHKIQVYEGGIRVPLFFVWPGVIERGTSFHTPVQHVDLYPTLSSFMGADLGHLVDGLSLYGLIMKGIPLPARELYWHYPHYMYENGAEVVRDERYKYIEFYKDGRKELYDLEEDPGERSNIIKEHPEKAGELKRKLYSWLERIGAKMPSRAENSIEVQ
jgi:arylsulfatase A-like enzyme